ncbi:ABC transporter substrate-binding protein [Frankia sp. Cr2]|uniref:ABC transporter substrate-binding protein n=1 Tax=Frankia sp. Cr2 TaxID=3073932 RepID=UPI002AD45239|nr:ABC transporter substrate-binding protein [Frankia sp. Cr2]
MPRSMFRGRHGIALAGVAALGLLVGCGGLSKNSAADAAKSCADPGVSADTLTFGLVYSDTGTTNATLLPFRAGVDARIGAENARGGVNGRRLTYAWGDDQNRPEQNLVAVRNLVTEEQAFGIVQLAASDDTSSWLQNRGIPAVAALSASQASYDNVFTVTTYFPETTWPRFVRDHGGTSAAVLGVQFDPVSIQQKNAVVESLAASGINVVYARDVSGPNDNFAVIGREIKRLKADTLIISAAPDVYASVLDAAAQAGVTLKVRIGTLGYDPNQLSRWGAKLAGGVIAVNSAPFELNLPAHRAFLQGMIEYAPQIQPPNQQMALDGWIAADMFIQGVQAAGTCPTRQGFITGLNKVNKYTAGGLLAPVDLTSAVRQNPCNYFVQVSPDGVRFNVLSTAPLCGNSS